MGWPGHRIYFNVKSDLFLRRAVLDARPRLPPAAPTRLRYRRGHGYSHRGIGCERRAAAATASRLAVVPAVARRCCDGPALRPRADRHGGRGRPQEWRRFVHVPTPILDSATLAGNQPSLFSPPCLEVVVCTCGEINLFFRRLGNPDLPLRHACMHPCLCRQRRDPSRSRPARA